MPYCTLKTLKIPSLYEDFFPIERAQSTRTWVGGWVGTLHFHSRANVLGISCEKPPVS